MEALEAVLQGGGGGAGPGVSNPEEPADMTPAVEQHGTVRPADPSLADDRQTMSTHIGELLCAVAELVAKLDIGQPPMADLGPRDDAAAAAAV
ncbi:unnamed protein product [Lampetra fluviatilis]